MVRQKKISTWGHVLTLFIVILAIIAYKVPRFSELLVYDRQAILSGELWRLLTAPLVHFSASHIFWNAVVFGVAGLVINATGFRGFALVCALGTVMPGLTYLLSFPELEHYGGLSGPATGAVVYFCLCSSQKSRKNRMIWLGMLVATGAKIFLETEMGVLIFAQTGSIPFRVLPSAHLFGALGAFAANYWYRPSRVAEGVSPPAATPHVCEPQTLSLPMPTGGRQRS